MNQPQVNLEDFSKIELLLGIKDGDLFQVKNDSTLYKYNKGSSTIQDELGKDIAISTLLNIINHPEIIEHKSEGVNTYQLLNEMSAKYIGLCSVFAVFSFILFFLINHQVNFSFFSIFLMILFAINIAGSGVMAGIFITNLLLNKESII